MRLKKIPAGKKTITFINNSDDDCVLFLNKSPFLFIRAKCFHIIEAAAFIAGNPRKHFPEMQLYAKRKIEILFV